MVGACLSPTFPCPSTPRPGTPKRPHDSLRFPAAGAREPHLQILFRCLLIPGDLALRHFVEKLILSDKYRELIPRAQLDTDLEAALMDFPKLPVKQSARSSRYRSEHIRRPPVSPKVFTETRARILEQRAEMTPQNIESFLHFPCESIGGALLTETLFPMAASLREKILRTLCRDFSFKVRVWVAEVNFLCLHHLLDGGLPLHTIKAIKHTNWEKFRAHVDATTYNKAVNFLRKLKKNTLTCWIASTISAPTSEPVG